MTMSRESIRQQMQEQRPTRKRQLYEVAPSPPKKLRCPTPDYLSSSPIKGPLVENSDDESPRFRTKSFYGSKKRLILPCKSGESENHNELHTLPVAADSGIRKNIKTSARRSADKRKNMSDDEELTKRRTALSPIKNIYTNGTKSEKKKALQKAVVNHRRGKSVSPKARLNVQTKLPPEPHNSSEKEHNEIITPDKPRKFFKYKSPGSASKASGGNIVQKGFNFKFFQGAVRGQKNQVASKKTPAKQSIHTKDRKTGNIYTPEMKAVVQRKSEEFWSSGKVWDHTGTPGIAHSEASSTSGMTTNQCDIIELETDFQTPKKNAGHGEFQWISVSSDTSDQIYDERPEVWSSQSLLSTDFQTVGSDVSGPVVQSCSDTTLQSSLSSVEKDHHGKVYSVFKIHRSARPAASDISPSGSSVGTPILKSRKFITAKGDDRQLMLDAGQENFGATQCKVCGMVYTIGNSADEATHYKFHLSALTALKFTGWKKERVIKDFLDDGSRVILVVPEDQRFMVKKVEDVNRVMGQELGYPEQTFSFHGSFKAFLYISDEKRVEGCCMAESVTQGYRIIPNSQGMADSQRSLLCSTVPVPATVGIGRLWVYGPSRRHGIASRLLDCVGQWFEYGIMIPKSQMAFSDPTHDGRMFAAKYTGTPSFLVYKYNNPSC